jgi:hypothetical protein
MANVVVSALATWNGKALKKGKQDVSAFDKQVSKLGRTFAGVFSAAALLSFSKKAVNAFAADERAAKALEVQLKNTGNEFSAPAVEMYIANLQKVSGVLDDELRPAFQSLLTVTSSVALSQYALNTALEVSAATGASVVQVSQALAKGFGGQTKALKTLVPGLDAAALKSADMETILKELNRMFAGQSAARLTTYAGKMDLLAVAASNSTEIIGKGLVDALTELSKDKSISSLATSMENLATNTATAITEIAKLIGKFTDLTGNPSFKAGLLALALLTKNPKIVVGVMGYVGGSAALGLASQDYGLGNQGGTPFGQSGSASQLAKDTELKRLQALNKLRKEENDRIKAKNDLERLKDKYDLERINLMAALNATTDEETRLRLAEKLAILDGNAARAQEYIAADEAYDWRLQEINSLKELTAAQYLAASSMTTLADWVAYRTGERASTMSNVPGGGGGMALPSAVLNTQSADWQAYRAGERGDVNITVQGSLLTDQDLADTIQNTILNLNRQGRGLTPAGGLSGGT